MSVNIAWMDNAACAGHPFPDIFFPDKPGKQSRADTAEAKRVCATCPVIAACAAFRSETGSTGVWGAAVTKVKDARTPDVVRVHQVARCGTPGGYAKHMRNGEPICEPCRTAEVARKAPNGSSRVKRWSA